MAAGEEKSNDFYAVMGLKKECTPAELRNAYKKLAMKWHPDRCSASGNAKYVEQAKKKFQAVQQAYSVLSDANKRFLYDVGVYDCDDDDDDENGMGDFLDEMAAMMNQNKSNEKRNESFEDLQQLFVDIFHSDTEVFGSSRSATPPTCLLSQDSCSESYSTSNKRNSSDMSSSNLSMEYTQFKGFSMGTGGKSEKKRVGESSRRKNTKKGSRRRDGRKQKTSTSQDVSSSDYSSISA